MKQKSRRLYFLSGFRYLTSSALQSGPPPISAPSRWEPFPNPEITLRVSCAFWENAGHVFSSFFKSTQVDPLYDVSFSCCHSFTFLSFHSIRVWDYPNKRKMRGAGARHLRECGHTPYACYVFFFYYYNDKDPLFCQMKRKKFLNYKPKIIMIFKFKIAVLLIHLEI